MSGAARDDVEVIQALGLDAAELRVYELLLDEPGSRIVDVAAASGWSAHRVQRALAALEHKGLATRSAHRSARFLPTPPDIAIEALAAKRHDELQRARAAAMRLLSERTLAAKTLREREHVVELVTGRDAQARVFEQIQRGAQEELLSIERPPYVVGSVFGVEVQEQAMARGVVYRNILEADALR
ncbi:MAG TPA: helix-turn-helix domain-containing protein, partial [Dokdonella sp.]